MSQYFQDNLQYGCDRMNIFQRELRTYTESSSQLYIRYVLDENKKNRNEIAEHAFGTTTPRTRALFFG